MNRSSFALALLVILVPMDAIADDESGSAVCEDLVRLMRERCRPLAPGPTNVVDCLRATADVKYACEAAGPAMACRGANGRAQVWCNANNVPIRMDAQNRATMCAEARADTQSFCHLGNQ